MKGAKRILRAGLLLALLPAAGCLSPHRSAVADVDPLGWREAAEVRFPNADTLAVCDLWLVVRYDAAFAGGPVDLEVTTVAPDSLRATEPFTLRLALSRGPSPLLCDTAVLYRNEEMLGAAVEASDVPRERLFLASKVPQNDLGYDRLLYHAEQSMRRLKTDYLDLCLIHWPAPCGTGPQGPSSPARQVP